MATVNSLLYWWVEWLVKSSVLLGVTFLLLARWKRARASVRQRFLAGVFLAILLLPLFSFLSPAWRIGLLPYRDRDSRPNPRFQVFPIGGIRSPSATWVINQVPSAGNGIPGGNPHPALPNPTPGFWIIAIWGASAAVCLIRLLSGLARTSKITRTATAITGHEWQSIISEFQNRFPLSRKVDLLRHRAIPVPITWGIRQPVILLPRECDDWNQRKRTAILFHELFHIRSRDFFLNILCGIGCAIFWCNPLVWLAFRRLRLEQEKACDEAVVAAGIKPSEYASCLLEMKQKWNPAAAGAMAAGMAGEGKFIARVTHILTDFHAIKEVSMIYKTALFSMLFLVFVLLGAAGPKALPQAGDEAYAVSSSSGWPQQTAKSSSEDGKKEKKKEGNLVVFSREKDEKSGKMSWTVLSPKDGDPHMLIAKEGMKLPDGTQIGFRRDAKNGNGYLIWVSDDNLIWVNDDEKLKKARKFGYVAAGGSQSFTVVKGTENDELIKLAEECRNTAGQISDPQIKEKLSAKLDELSKKLDASEAQIIVENGKIHTFAAKTEPTAGLDIMSLKRIPLGEETGAEGKPDVGVRSTRKEPGLADVTELIDDPSILSGKGQKLLIIMSKNFTRDHKKEIDPILDDIRSQLPAAVAMKFIPEKGIVRFEVAPESEGKSTFNKEFLDRIETQLKSLKTIPGGDSSLMMLLMVKK